jgi:hypothetical protein
MAKKVEKDKKLSNKADDKYKQSLQGMKEAQEKMFESEMPKVLEVRTLYLFSAHKLPPPSSTGNARSRGRKTPIDEVHTGQIHRYIILLPHSVPRLISNALKQQGSRKICFKVPRRLASP